MGFRGSRVQIPPSRLKLAGFSCVHLMFFLMCAGRRGHSLRVAACTSRGNGEDQPCPPPKPPVKLIGQDGNAFAVLGACQRAARRAGWSAEQWSQVRDEMTSGDYDHLLATAMEHFDVS